MQTFKKYVKDHSLFDGDNHFYDNGHLANFNYIYNNYFIKYI
jgi:hypothetical protein